MEITGYHIDKIIGQGGMATVYRAQQATLHRPVALKVLHAEYAANTEFAQRFLEEGRTTARLNDPQIITVHDTGVDNGHYYLAMEYLPGGTLKRRISQGLTLEHALNIAERVGRGLAYAHSRHIIHCDIKPGNILFRASGEPVITDFGIARSAHQSSASGLKLGSPRYMSPEQACDAALDERSDLYSLGVIFYEMLTGHPPYQHQDPLTLAQLHLEAPIPRLPSELKEFQNLIDHLLAKQPEQRYTIAEQFLQALQEARQSYWAHHNAGTVPIPIVADDVTRILQVTPPRTPPPIDTTDTDATRQQAYHAGAASDQTAPMPTPAAQQAVPSPRPRKTTQHTSSSATAPPSPTRRRWLLFAVPVVLIAALGLGVGLYGWLKPTPVSPPTPAPVRPIVQLLPDPDPVDETPPTVTPVEPTPEPTAAELARLPGIGPIQTLDTVTDQEPEHDPSLPANLPGIGTPAEEQTPAVPITPVEPPIIDNDDALDPLRAAIEQGDYVLSLALLDQQIADQPANRALRDLRQQIQVQVILEQVSELRRDNRLQPALTAINQGLREFPDEPSLQVVAQEVRTALADQRNRIHADDHLQRARALYQQGQLESALQEVEQGLEYLPRHAELRILRARITVDQTYTD